MATYVWASDWAFSAEEGTVSTPDSIYISAVQDPVAGQSQFSYGAYTQTQTQTYRHTDTHT